MVSACGACALFVEPRPNTLHGEREREREREREGGRERGRERGYN